MNRELVSSFVSALGTLSLVGQVLLVFLIILYASTFVFKKKNPFKKVLAFVSQNALSFAFLIAIVATTGSLFLSEVANFNPCKLCWYQRIFMYPQVILLGLGAIKNDLNVRTYSLILAVIGVLISTYHYALQMSPLPLPCTDEVASCAAKQYAAFGYITIPLMAWTAFLLIIVLMLLSRRK